MIIFDSWKELAEKLATEDLHAISNAMFWYTKLELPASSLLLCGLRSWSVSQKPPLAPFSVQLCQMPMAWTLSTGIHEATP
jgi:hypothetical protein